jgi:hypothetical protein
MSKGNPESLTQQVKILKPNDYWLNQPLHVLTNKYAPLSEDCSEAEGEKTPTRPTQSTAHIRVGSTKHSTPQRVTCYCDGKRLKSSKYSTETKSKSSQHLLPNTPAIGLQRGPKHIHDLAGDLATCVPHSGRTVEHAKLQLAPGRYSVRFRSARCRKMSRCRCSC